MKRTLFYRLIMKQRKLVRAFLREERGATAFEFGLVLIPFLGFLFMIIEVGLFYLASIEIENAAVESSRQIRTGQAIADGLTAEQFRNLTCESLTNMVRCDGNFHVDVRSFQDFGGADPAALLGEDGAFVGPTVFEPGGPSDVVVVRVFYYRNLTLPFASDALANTPDGQQVLSTTLAFRNEPFGSLLD